MSSFIHSSLAAGIGAQSSTLRAPTPLELAMRVQQSGASPPPRSPIASGGGEAITVGRKQLLGG